MSPTDPKYHRNLHCWFGIMRWHEIQTHAWPVNKNGGPTIPM